MPIDLGPLIVVIGLLIFGFMGLTILAPIVVAVKRRSKLAGVIAIAIAIYWANALVWPQIVRPQLEADWRSGAREKCEAELAPLPDTFEGRSLLDESAGLSLPLIVQLLTERGMDFVELKPVVTKDGQQRWLLPRDQWADLWLLPAVDSPYVRLRLSTTNDPACRSELNDHHWSRMPPLLPDTCLAIDAIDSPSAELALEHEPADGEFRGSYGFRRLIKREPRQLLAQLTTSESAGATYHYAGHRLRTSDGADGRLDDCGVPFFALVDRVRSPTKPNEPTSPQLIRTRWVKASRSLEDLLTSGPELQKLHIASETYAYLTPEQESSIFTRAGFEEGWRETVEAAQRQKEGKVPYMDRLLDLRNRELIGLQGTWQHPWKTHALLDGFFVLKEFEGWDKSAGNLLVRFDRQGAFEWAVSVVPPSAQSDRPMHVPRALLVVDNKLVIADRRRTAKPSDGGPSDAESRLTQWEIPLNQLPAMASSSDAARSIR